MSTSRCALFAHKVFYVGPGLPHKGPGAAGMPATGVRQPLPPHLQAQMDGANRPGQPRPHMPGMDNHAAPQANKDDGSGANSAVQEDAPKKVFDHFLKS